MSSTYLYADNDTTYDMSVSSTGTVLSYTDITTRIPLPSIQAKANKYLKVRNDGLNLEWDDVVIQSGVDLILDERTTSNPPSILFEDSNGTEYNTGINMYRDVANANSHTISFYANNVKKMDIAENRILCKEEILLPDGTQSQPSISFESDPDTGLCRAGANHLRVVANNEILADFTTTHFRSRKPLHSENGSVTAPTYSFEGDDDTGIYRKGANNLAITTGGVERVDVNTLDTNFKQIVSQTIPSGDSGFFEISRNVENCQSNLNVVKDWFLNINGAQDTFNEQQSWYDIIYNDVLKLYVAISREAFTVSARTTTNKVATSPDGYTWTLRTTPLEAGIQKRWHSIDYNTRNGIMVAVSAEGAESIMRSTDGITWVDMFEPASFAWEYIKYFEHINTWIGSGSQPPNPNGQLMWSTNDGLTWSTAASSFYFGPICYNSKTGFYYTGSGQSFRRTNTPFVVSSWVETASNVSGTEWIAYSPDLNMIVCGGSSSGNNNQVSYSVDNGATFTIATISNDTINQRRSGIWCPKYKCFIVACCNASFSLADYGSSPSGKVFYSFNGINWIDAGLPTAQFYWKLHYNQARDTLIITSLNNGNTANKFHLTNPNKLQPTADNLYNGIHQSMDNSGNWNFKKDVDVVGDVSCVDITATGDVSCVDITATGNVSCVDLTATGDVSCVDITATGNVSCVDLTATGDLSCVDLTATGKVVHDGIIENRSGTLTNGTHDILTLTKSEYDCNTSSGNVDIELQGAAFNGRVGTRFRFRKFNTTTTNRIRIVGDQVTRITGPSINETSFQTGSTALEIVPTLYWGGFDLVRTSDAGDGIWVIENLHVYQSDHEAIYHNVVMNNSLVVMEDLEVRKQLQYQPSSVQTVSFTISTVNQHLIRTDPGLSTDLVITLDDVGVGAHFVITKETSTKELQITTATGFTYNGSSRTGFSVIAAGSRGILKIWQVSSTAWFGEASTF